MKQTFKRRRLLITAICAFVILFSTQGCRKDPRYEPVPAKEVRAEAALQQIVEDYDAAGLSVAVVKDNEIIYTKAIGKKDIETNAELTTDDIFCVASISKSFVVTTVMKLIEEGRLGLDDDASDLLGFRVRNPRFPDTPITLSMLLSHSSSMKDGGIYSMKAIDTDDPEVYARHFYDYAPGTRYNYCNLAYNIVGNIIERASGQRFDIAVYERAIEPLGIEAGYNASDLDGSKFVTLYIYKQDAETKEWTKTPTRSVYAARNLSNYRLGYSAAGVFSPTGDLKISAPDLAYYMRMHMNYGMDPVTGVRVISEENSRLMQAPKISIGTGAEYCFGLSRTTNVVKGKLLIGHTGSLPGVLSAMYFQPDEEIGIVVISNGSMPGQSVEYLPRSIHNETVIRLYEIFV